jgi:hypothetical protein
MSDANPNEVYFDPPFYGEILPNSGDLIPRDRSSEDRWAIDQDGYEDAGIDTFESGARVLAEWLGECWHTSGGAGFPIPVYVNHHDRSSYYELRVQRWVEESDVWP